MGVREHVAKTDRGTQGLSGLGEGESPPRCLMGTNDGSDSDKDAGLTFQGRLKFC